MSGTLGKLAPTAIVCGLVAWCCWPHLEGSHWATGVQPAAELPRLAGELLSPQIEPAPDRDPFQPPPVRKPAPPENRQPAEPPPGKVEHERTVVEEAPVDVFSGLALGAIYIRGDRRVALINGRVYQQGQPLVLSVPAADPCIVTEVSAERVLLLHRGQTVELKYAAPVLRAENTEDARKIKAARKIEAAKRAQGGEQRHD